MHESVVLMLLVALRSSSEAAAEGLPEARHHLAQPSWAAFLSVGSALRSRLVSAATTGYQPDGGD
jgi:hypothetical protein